MRVGGRDTLRLAKRRIRISFGLAALFGASFRLRGIAPRLLQFLTRAQVAQRLPDRGIVATVNRQRVFRLHDGVVEVRARRRRTGTGNDGVMRSVGAASLGERERGEAEQDGESGEPRSGFHDGYSLKLNVVVLPTSDLRGHFNGEARFDVPHVPEQAGVILYFCEW